VLCIDVEDSGDACETGVKLCAEVLGDTLVEAEFVFFRLRLAAMV